MLNILRKIIFFLSIVTVMSSCYSEKEKIKISTTSWIGYTPLFYAKEKGWLEHLNIKLLNVVSLAENMYLFKAGNSDAFAGTQFEYNYINSKSNSLIPIILFNKSNGGDVVMSNFSIEELSKTVKPIDIYLEIDSINSILIEDFIKKFNLSNKTFNYINKDQAFISTLDNNQDSPTLIVSYVPYNNILEKNGFKELFSTKNNNDILIIDALFVSKDLFYKNEKRFIELKKFVDLSIQNLQKNPKEFYETVKPYLGNSNFEEFLASLNDILWINTKLSKELELKLQSGNFPLKDVIK